MQNIPLNIGSHTQKSSPSISKCSPQKLSQSIASHNLKMIGQDFVRIKICAASKMTAINANYPLSLNNNLNNNMNQTEEFFDTVENSRKTCQVESTTTDTNSRSFNSIISRKRQYEKYEKEFDQKLFERAVPSDDEEEKIKKVDFEEHNKNNSQLILPQKKQGLKLGEKNIQTMIAERKKEVRKILDAPSLRDKFAHLLPTQMRLSIGYIQTKLISKMACIDRCIIIISRNSDKKHLSISEIQKNAKLMKETIEDKDFRQIIFLIENFGNYFSVEWMKNELKPTEYELCVVLPTGVSLDERIRKCEFRISIQKFLVSKYIQYLNSKEIDTKTVDFSTLSRWGHGFNIEDIRIPLGHYPEHPFQKRLSVSSMRQEQIESISNNNLKQIIKDTIAFKTSNKLKYEQQDPSKSTNFKNKLYNIIKSREQFYEDQKRLQMMTENSVQKKLLLSFCEQACALFIERRVSTMFRINFLDLMKRRLDIAGPASQIEDLLDNVMNKNIKFLTKIQSAKGVMIQITKENYNEILKVIKEN